VRKSYQSQVGALTVTRRFEPSHIAAECLAQAYESLVPILRRPMPMPHPLTLRPDPKEEQPRERRRS